MKALNINTHHAYLNTDIVLWSEFPAVDIIDKLTGAKYCVENGALKIKLCAGVHKLYSKSLNEEIVVQIEDAIKLGGSTIKNAFVFDNNPWVFVVTGDRMYATNTMFLDIEKVEFNITPEEIRAFDNSEYFLFRTQNDYSIYNVIDGAFVFAFTNYIYSNSQIVIYKEDNDIVVFNYQLRREIVKFFGRYSIGEKFYYINNNQLYGLDLTTSHINLINQVGNLDDNCILSGNSLLKLKTDNICQKIYQFFDLGNGKTTITELQIELPYYISSFNKVETEDYEELCNYLDMYESRCHELFRDYAKELFKNSKLYCHITPSFKVFKIDDITNKIVNDKKINMLHGEVITYSKPLFGSLKKEQEKSYTIIESETNELKYVNAKFVTRIDKSIKENTIEEKNNIANIIGKSTSGKKYLVNERGILTYHDITENKHHVILGHLYDTTAYNSAYFTSDGKSIVFEKNNKTLGIMDFDEMIQKPFHIEGATVARNEGFNGYKPEIQLIDESQGRIPVWRDPISLMRIEPRNMSNHVFQSADGKYTADTKMEIVYYNILTHKELSLQEFLENEKRYNFLPDDTGEQKEIKIIQRESLLNKFGKDSLCTHLTEYYTSFYTKSNNISLSKEELDIQINNELNDYIYKKNEFTPLFIEERGYINYKETDNDMKKRILIGRSVWFLNYVSFSYDSRYLSFAAKMREDKFRHTQEGVFGLYDLEKETIVIKQDKEQELYAVWMTMFSKTGDVAYYDSHANAYIHHAADKYKKANKILGKSLLCFSPSGKYIAFSDQNYIDYTHHKNEKWGHQPSGNIFIHSVINPNKCIDYFNDFAEGINGILESAHSVASAAFSSDEKKLLAVGTDGVIVIRNLHFDDTLSQNKIEDRKYIVVRTF